jgi:hypothetical protein
MLLSNKTFQSKITLVVAAIILVSGIIYGLREPSYSTQPGYCNKQKRFISDEEFIQIAIKKALKFPMTMRPDIDGSESSMRDLKVNDCCKIGRYLAGNHWDDQWLARVGLKYKTKQKDYDRTNPDEYVAFVVMDECGNYQD